MPDEMIIIFSLAADDSEMRVSRSARPGAAAGGGAVRDSAAMRACMPMRSRAAFCA